jgi:hypothetical protein
LLRLSALHESDTTGTVRDQLEEPLLAVATILIAERRRYRPRFVRADDPIERPVPVAVPVQASNEVAAVLMAERNRDVL